MPLTSAYWPLPFASVVQSVFMVVLLPYSMELRTYKDSVGGSDSSIASPQPASQGESQCRKHAPGQRHDHQPAHEECPQGERPWLERRGVLAQPSQTRATSAGAGLLKRTVPRLWLD